MHKSKKEVFTISINITKLDKIEGNTGEVSMIYFTGYVDCAIFKGNILQEGTDTQLHYYSKEKALSARYMLEGLDSKSKPCRLFIENNATIPDGDLEKAIQTVPKIITDSKELAWLETAELTGEIEAAADKLLIHIYILDETGKEL